MMNLAGDSEADHHIERELTRCGVEIVRREELLRSEVPTHLTGRLVTKHGEITFKRAWCYWVTDGFVPLATAEKLYEHPVGREDVRVAGHCGCPPPHEWVEHFDAQEHRIWPIDQKPTPEKIADSSKTMRRIYEEELRDNVFAEDPAKAAARSGITTYHIDSELGLYLFVEALRV